MKASWGVLLAARAVGWRGLKSRVVADHLPEISASQVGFYPLVRSTQGSLLGKQGFGWDQGKGTLLSRELLLLSGTVSKPALLADVPESCSEARHLFTPKAGSRGRDRAGSLLTGSWRERPFRPEKHMLFLP